MHAWMCHNPVGTDALQWQELPTPAPAAGQALVAEQFQQAPGFELLDSLVVHGCGP